MKKPWFLFSAILLVALLFSLSYRWDSPPKQAPAKTPPPAQASADAPHTVDLASKAPTEASTDFDQWLASNEKAVSEQIIAQAKTRRERMRWLIQNDPQQAIIEAVTWAEHQQLPAEILPYVEQPFSEVATLQALPNCGSHDHAGHDHNHETAPVSYVLLIGQNNYQAGVYGRRTHLDTKEGLSLQGILLDDLAAVRDEVMQPLSPEDAEALAHLPVLNPDPQRGYATGKTLDDNAVVGLAGERLAYFANADALAEFNAQLAKMDAYPGPHSSAETAFAMAYPADGASDGYDYDALDQEVALQADSWTETVKKVFFIRVDFSDLPGESVSQGALQLKLDTEVSPNIFDQSLGKTYLDSDVSSMVVRLPSTTATYVNSPNATSQNNLLHTDARAAFDALATGIDLGEYDIVGVHFAFIGMQSGGGAYSGLAGGGRQWLQGTTSAETIVHEFGHNYGLAHARQWNTTDGSVLGTGASVEYGDISDIMGDGPFGDGYFHGQARDRLNWFEDEIHWTDATTNGAGTYRIYQLDDVATNQAMRSVRVTRAANEYFWIGYRNNLENAWFDAGAYLVWQQSGTTSGWLMDTTPDSYGTTSADAEDAALLPGRTFSDATSDVHITTLGTGGTSPDTWLDVHIEFGPFPGNNNPTASISGATNISPRTTQTYTATANDGDGDTLAYYWDTDDGVIHENQDSISQSFNVGGSYDIELVVSDRKGGTVTATKSITVTDPLDTWTEGTAIAGRDMDNIVYLNGRYIATGDDYILTSFDGANWSEQYISANFNDGGANYGNGVYVVAAYDHRNGDWRGVLYSSTNGFNWTDRTTLETERFRDVAYGNGRFVAVGDIGLIHYSIDGVSWTATTPPTAENFEQIAFGNGVFIAESDNGLWRSEDGITWTNYWANLGISSSYTLRDVFFHNGLFFTGGFYTDIFYSADGINWTAATMPDTGSKYNTVDFAAYENTIVAYATRYTGDIDVILVSSDGTSWSESTSAPAIYEYTIDEVDYEQVASTVAYGNGFFLSVYGEDGNISQSDSLFPGNSAPTATVAGPTTGDAREYLTFTATVNDADDDALIYSWNMGNGTHIDGTSVTYRYPGGGTFDIVLTVTDQRGGVTTDTHQVTISDPLNTWNARTSGTASNLNDICVGAGGRLVAVGESSGTYRYSDDGGTTWSGGTINANVYLYGVIWDGSKFIAVGMDWNGSTWAGIIFTSADGSSWTQRYFTGERLNDVAFDGSTYIAVGDAGTYVTSADGVSWTGFTFGSVSENLEGIDYSGTHFVIVGNSSGVSATILTSDDGSSWTDNSGGFGTTQGPYKVQFCNDRFLASGFLTRLRISTDNGATFSTNRTNRERIEAFAFGNDVYLASGIDQDSGNAPITLISLDGENWEEITTPAVSYINAALFHGGTFIMVGDGGQIWQTESFTGLTADPWTEWQLTYFPSVVEDALPEADYENDGLPNLYEYYAGGNPLVADPALAPMLTWDGGFTFTLPQDLGVTGLTLDVLKSTNLINWIPATYTDVSTTPGEVILDITDAPSAGNPLFLQIEVTQD